MASFSAARFLLVIALIFSCKDSIESIHLLREEKIWKLTSPPQPTALFKLWLMVVLYLTPFCEVEKGSTAAAGMWPT